MFLKIVNFFYFWGMNKKQRSCYGREGGAQRPVWHVNEPSNFMVIFRFASIFSLISHSFSLQIFAVLLQCKTYLFSLPSETKFSLQLYFSLRNRSLSMCVTFS